VKLVIENLGWKSEKAKNAQQGLIDLCRKMKKNIGYDDNVIVHLYDKKIGDSTVRAEYDEGVIILYQTTPDWRGDFLHELGHQIISNTDFTESVKLKLKKLKSKLDKKRDGRVFVQPHTHSTQDEVFCTLFKWYVMGKTSSDTYLEVLRSSVPGGIETIESFFGKNKIKKQFVLSPNNAKGRAPKKKKTLMQYISDEDIEMKGIEEAIKRISKKVNKFKTTDEVKKMFVNLAINEIIKLKKLGRIEDVRTILAGGKPEKRYSQITIKDPGKIKKDVQERIIKSFSAEEGKKIKFNLGIIEPVLKKIEKDELISLVKEVSCQQPQN
jgi:hypothetical protein